MNTKDLHCLSASPRDMNATNVLLMCGAAQVTKSAIWPSLETASRLSDWANAALFISLAIGVIATGFIIWTASIKEQHWDRLRDSSAEEVAHANEGAAAANAEAKKAIQKTASLEQEAAAARLETERLRSQLSWRELDQTQAQQFLAFCLTPEMRTLKFKLSWQSSTEAHELTNQIYRLLLQSGITPLHGNEYMDMEFYNSKVKGPPGSEGVATLLRALGILGLKPVFESAAELEMVIGLKEPPKLR